MKIRWIAAQRGFYHSISRAYRPVSPARTLYWWGYRGDL